MPEWQTTGNAAAAGDVLGTTNAQPLVVQAGGAEQLRIQPDGKIGAGLSDPRTELHVLGRIATGLDHKAAGAISFFPPDGFAWFHIDNGPAGRGIGRLRVSHGVIPGDKELMTLVQDGNVGVGRPDPAVKFHVDGNRIRLESGGKRLDLRADGAAVDIQSETHDIYLHSAGPRRRNNVIINPFGGEGNVAIGLTNPAVKLHVAGNRIRLESGGKQLDLRSDGAAVDIQSETHSVYLHSLGPRGRNHVIINPFGQSGNVGIATQAPTDKLHVVGNVRANDFIVTSDARLKADIHPLRGALAKLRRLRGVEFRWRRGARYATDPGASGKRLGVIAQEIEAVAPELVHRDAGGEGARGVNLGGMLATLVEATKELATENDRLRQRLDVLERGQTRPARAEA